MPPKFKFTREQIISAALDITREKGMDALTARGLASKLGSSAKPIFGLFQNMDEVQSEVINSANKLYLSYLQKCMADNAYPPYKSSGIAYIQFAKEEKELFKLLFMRDRTNESIEESKDEIQPLLEIIKDNLGISEDKAFLFHSEMWIFVHGIASMAATSYLDWDMDYISRTLTDVYEGLKYRFTGGN